MRKSTVFFMLIISLMALISGTVIILNPAAVGLVTGAFALPEETGRWEVHFCPEESCMDYLNRELAAASSASCAFYELNLFNTTSILLEKEALVFIDEDNVPSSYYLAYPIKGEGLMHHKFCVMDTGIVATGSFNPTFFENSHNDNNLFIIDSPNLRENYAAEIESLAGKEVKTPHPEIMHDGFLIENYFCPRDNCERRVADALDDAQESVYFMEYTFTSNRIENTLAAMQRSGIEVKGVIEKFQSANEETFEYLTNANIDVRWDGNPKLMHHKVFIIDNSTVIFGSYNPTKAATEINRENILIVHNPELAAEFLREWERVWGMAEQ